MNGLQEKIVNWALRCFGREVVFDERERGYRFVEEALELAQAGDISKEDVLRLVDYVYSRPKGEIRQEFGGVSVTLYVLAQAHGFFLEDLVYIEILRCEQNIDKIRAKHLSKSIRGPSCLPGESNVS